MLNDPNQRILIISATATNAAKFLREIQSVFEENAIFQWLFPELIPDFGKVRWNTTEMEIVRPKTYSEASIESIGIGGSAVSRHYDELIKDDLVNEDHILYPEQMQKVVDFHKHSYSLFVSPARGIDTIIGTRWSHNDLIQHILDNSSKQTLGNSNPFAYECIVRSAIEDGKAIFPTNGLGEDEFTLDHLNAILEDQGPFIFSCQYLNNPTHEDSRSFLPDWNRYYEIAPLHLRCFTAVDPATGRGDSFSAIATVGTDAERNIYVLEARKANLGTDELIEEIIRQHMVWKSRVGIEFVAFQKILTYPLREAMRKYNISFNVQELKPITTQKKSARVSGILQPVFASGRIFIKREYKDLIKELAWFPAIEHYDLLDALAYAVQMAKYPTRTETTINDPFSLESIMEELERKGNASRNPKSPWIWNQSGPREMTLEELLKIAPPLKGRA